jgi:hypothetical protein
MSLHPDIQAAAHSFEIEWSGRVGGKVTPASGATWHAKQDVQDRTFLWSLKLTTKNSFRLTKEVLDDLFDDTWTPGGRPSVPALGIRIGTPEYDVVVLRYSDFASLARGELIIVGEEHDRAVKEAFARMPQLLREDGSH